VLADAGSIPAASTITTYEDGKKAPVGLSVIQARVLVTCDVAVTHPGAFSISTGIT
jgi:hypothetical protein